MQPVNRQHKMGSCSSALHYVYVQELSWSSREEISYESVRM